MAYSISSAYQTALTSSTQDIITQATILSNGAPLAGVPNLYVVSGTVTADSSRQFYRSMSVKCVDPTGVFTPTQSQASNLLSPYGTEVALYRGLQGYGLIPLGIFRITKVAVTDSPTDFHIDISGFDRSYTVAQQRWTDVYTISAGTVNDTAIQSIISARFGFTITYRGFSYGTTTPLVTYALDSGTQDPWSACQQLAQPNGTVIYFDVSGNCYETTVPVPGQAVNPVFSFVEGPTCTITGLQTNWVTENVSNDVIVLGEGSGITTPTYGRAYVANSSNPMNIHGTFGDCPQIIKTNLATSNAIAQTMAQLQLNKNTGLTQTIQLQCIPAPQLDVYDVIYVKRARSGVAAPYIINSLTCPMEPGGTMSITAQISEYLS